MIDYNKKMNKLYKDEISIHPYRILDRFCNNFERLFCEKNGKDFYLIEPIDCEIIRLLNNSVSDEIGKLVKKIAYSIVAYGKAYVYISPTYTIVEENQDETKKLVSFELGEIKGFIKKRIKDEIIFCCKAFNNVVDKKMLRNQLIVFDISELGYSRKYFYDIMIKLDRNNSVYNTADMFLKNVDGYDYEEHIRKCDLNELKIVKNKGIILKTDKLSDSYIFYKKIQEIEFKEKLLKYILDILNVGIADFLKIDNPGKIEINMKKIEYGKIWDDYCEGIITGTELNRILFDA